ncbi:MAG: HAD hydrolase-like protein [Bacilli bacterium]|nr:HAD hydrolase-like protein [Bacilli bacterium]
MKNALIFDLDGTLWDALESDTIGWNKAMIKEGKPYRFTLEETSSYMGLTPEETYVKAFPNESENEQERLFHACIAGEIEELLVNPGTLYPHEYEVLETLMKDYDLYIVSNCDSGYIEAYLEACHTEKYFKDFLSVGKTGLVKHDNIKKIIADHKIQKAIYIGDTRKDYDESTLADIPFIHASYGFGSKIEGVERISSLDELPGLLKKIGY